LDKTLIENASEEIINSSLSLGADQAEVFATKSRILLGRFMNRQQEVEEREAQGIGLRIIKDHGVAFVSSSSFDEKSLVSLVDRALKIAKTIKMPFGMHFPSPSRPSSVDGLFDKKIDELNTAELIDSMDIMVSSARDYHNSIKEASGCLRAVSQETWISNSNGLEVSTTETFFESYISVLAKQQTEEAEGFDSTGGRAWRAFFPEELSRNASRMAKSGFHPSRIESKEYQLVLGHEPTAEITSLLNALTSSLLSRQYYPTFRVSENNKIASEKFSFFDHQDKPSGYGAVTFDDEGIPARKIPLIVEGEFVSFIYDTLNSLVEGKSVTGGANRNPLKYPLMSNVRNPPIGLLPRRNHSAPPDPIGLNPSIQPGSEKKEEMISETKDGLLVEMMHYPGRTTKDFSAILRMGLSKIENGEIAGRIESCRFVADIVKMLGDIDMISSEQRVSGSWFSGMHEAPVIRTKARIFSLT